MSRFDLSGNVVDVVAGRIFGGTVTVDDGRIVAVRAEPNQTFDQFIMPGFVDAHVHIESSMMVPSEFARFATVHGTVAAVSDPHEIANVLGVEGVRLMIDNGRRTPFKFHFGRLPACPPRLLRRPAPHWMPCPLPAYSMTLACDTFRR